MNDIGSYLGIGIALIAGFYIFVYIRRPIFLKLALKNFFHKKFKYLVLIVLITFISSIISSVVYINDSFQKYSSSIIEEKIGVTNGIIYSRDKNKSWNLHEASKIFGSVIKEFEGFLPIYYKKDSFEKRGKEKIILIYFDPVLVSSYAKNFSEVEVYKDLEKDEIIISKSLSDKFNIKEGDTVSFVGIQNKNLKVKKIVDDNGLIGFNLPLPSLMHESFGSVYISQELIPAKSRSDGLYNALLLKTSIPYSQMLLTNAVQDNLYKVDKSLVFEELKQSFVKKLYGQEGLSLAQVILLVNIPILIGLLLIYTVITVSKSFYEIKFDSLTKILNFSGFDLIIYNSIISNINVLIGSFLGGFIGALISVLFLNILGNYFFNNLSQVDFQINFNISSFLISLGLNIMILFLFNIVLLFSVSVRYWYFDLAKNKFLNDRYIFKLKDNSFMILVLLGSLIGFYYVLAGFIEEKTAGNLLLFYNIQMFTLSVSYLLFRYKQELKNLLVNVNSLVVILFNSLVYRYFDIAAFWQEFPFMYLINGVLILIAMNFLIVHNIFIIKEIIKKTLSKLGISFPSLNLAISLMQQQRNIVLLFFLMIFFILLLAFPVARNLILQIKESIDSKYDLVITDSLGKVPEEVVLESLNSFPIEKVINVSYGYVVLPDFSYQDIGMGEKAYLSGLDPKSKITEIISTFDETSLYDLNIKSNLNKDELINAFTGSDKYVILGSNYSQKLSDNNIRADLRVGDTVRLMLSGGVIIERKVIGLINDKSNEFISSSTTPNLQRKNGIFVSQFDAKKLNEKQQIYFSKLYGLIFSKDADKSEEIKKLIHNFEGKEVTSIFNPSSIFFAAIDFSLKIISLTEFTTYTGLIFIIVGVFTTLIHDFTNQRFKYKKNVMHGISRGFFIKSYIFYISIFLYLSFVFGTLIGYLYFRFFFDEIINPLDNNISFSFAMESFFNLLFFVIVLDIFACLVIYFKIKQTLNIYER